MVTCAQINRLEKKTIAIASPDKFVACSNRHNKSIGKVRKTGIISIVALPKLLHSTLYMLTFAQDSKPPRDKALMIMTMILWRWQLHLSHFILYYIQLCMDLTHRVSSGYTWRSYCTLPGNRSRTWRKKPYNFPPCWPEFGESYEIWCWDWQVGKVGIWCQGILSPDLEFLTTAAFGSPVVPLV